MAADLEGTLKVVARNAEGNAMNRSQLASLVAAGSLVLGTGIAVAEGGPSRPVLLSAAETTDTTLDETTDTTLDETTDTTLAETTETTLDDTVVETTPDTILDEGEEEGDLEVTEEEEEEVDGARAVNHGSCVSEAAQDPSLVGREKGLHVSEVARSEAGKDGVSCELPEDEVVEPVVEAEPEASVAPAPAPGRRPAHAGPPAERRPDAEVRPAGRGGQGGGAGRGAPAGRGGGPKR